MNCPQCQLPLPPDAQFCLRCGFPVAQALSGQMPAPGSGGTTGAQPIPSIPSMPPAYQPPASQPVNPLVYQPLASQPLYAPPAAAQPMYAPPSQPLYAAPPSQPMYSGPVPTPYAAPATTPLQTAPGSASGGLAGLLSSAPPNIAPANRVQAFMQRNVSARMATNPWFMAVAGALLAVVSGLILTAITEAIWSAAIDQALSALAATPENQIGSGMAKSLLTPDLLKFYLFEQHVPFTIHADISASGVGGGGDLSFGLPLTGLIVIPAIALIFGGYISSASDFTRSIRASLLRGALIGPFYGVILAIIALMSVSTIQASALSESVGFTLSASPIAAFLYGVFWGALFGALGGWIQVAGRRAFSAALPTMRALHSRWFGAATGGGVAILAGVLMSGALVAGYIPCALTLQRGDASAVSAASASPLSGLSTSNLPVFLLLMLAFLPTLASIAFAIFTGTPYEVTIAQASLLGNGSSQPGQSSSIGLIAAQSHPPLGPAYLLLLIPILAYVIGGRVSARAAGATRSDEALVAGVLISVPCAVLLAVLSFLLAFTMDVNALGLVSAGESAAPSGFGAFLAGLVGGAIFGALGGLSEVAAPRLGDVPRMLLVPLRPLGLAVDPLLDALTRHPRQQPRSVARRWFYDAVLLALALVVLVILLNILNALPVAILPFQVALTLDAVVAWLVVTLPLLYLAGGLVTLFSAPQNATPLVSGAGAPIAPIVFAPMAPPLVYSPVTGAPATGFPVYPVAPQYPVYPAAPGAPAYPSYPAYPGYPAPAYPAYPAYPAAPGAPGYPGAPSVPLNNPAGGWGTMPPAPQYPVPPAPPPASSAAPMQPPEVAGGSGGSDAPTVTH